MENVHIDLTPEGVASTVSTFAELFGTEVGQEVNIGYPAEMPTACGDQKPTPGYVIDPQIAKLVLMAVQSGQHFMLVGDLGAGKSSHLREILVRVNIGFEIIPCSTRTEPTDLFGYDRLVPSDNGNFPVMAWEDGPVTRALREGLVPIFEEIDNLAATVRTSLNTVLDRAPFTVPGSGEVIQPGEGMVALASANTVGNGEGAAQFAGAQTQSAAAISRWLVHEMDYPAPETEAAILQTVDDSLGPQFIEGLTKWAAELRKAANDEIISVAPSTRELMQICRVSINTMDPILAAELGYLNKIAKADRTKASEMFMQHLDEAMVTE